MREMRRPPPDRGGPRGEAPRTPPRVRRPRWSSGAESSH